MAKAAVFNVTNVNHDKNNFGMKKVDPGSMSFQSYPESIDLNRSIYNDEGGFLSQVIYFIEKRKSVSFCARALNAIIIVLAFYVAMLLMLPGITWLVLGTVSMASWGLSLMVLRKLLPNFMYNKLIDIFSLPQTKKL